LVQPSSAETFELSVFAKKALYPEEYGVRKPLRSYGAGGVLLSAVWCRVFCRFDVLKKTFLLLTVIFFCTQCFHLFSKKALAF